MSEHTPGPWMVDGTVALGAYGVWTAYGCEHNPHSPDNACLIASVYPSNQRGIPRSERDANARLIAAAPELLAALQTILCEAIDEHYASHDPDGALAFARKAIAKATGKINPSSQPV